MLAQMMLAQNATYRQIAGVLGIAPGTVCRRVCKIANRLYDPLVVRLIEHPGALRQEYRTLGIEYFLIGRSIAQLADIHKMPRSQIRAILQMLRVWHRA
jgi:hypothetical protein